LHSSDSYTRAQPEDARRRCDSNRTLKHHHRRGKMPTVHLSIAIVGLIALAVAASYSVLVLVAAVVWQRRRAPTKSSSLSPVTVLKPLCGAESGLYENLRSFCHQDYPEFQIVFGVRDATDPALLVVQRLQREFPSLPIAVMVSSKQHGSNRKVSNLVNMLELARHDVLVMADSDALVGPDYLAAVTAPLRDHEVGLVTCIFRDMPTRRIWSRLGAMYVNEWYMPSVLLARLFGHAGYASGQTLCLRRETLQGIGGLRVIADHLAEDNRLGELVRGNGQRIVLSPYLIKTARDEPTLDLLTGHELRWMRTLQVLRPRSFRLLFLSFSLPLALLGGALAATEPSVVPAAWMLFLTAMLARLALYLVHRLDNGQPLFSDLWLLPARDLLIFWVWCRTFFASRLRWCGSEFDVGTDGIIRNLS
jgi:ceramide glucosyltransferase